MFTNVDDSKNHVKNRLRQVCNNVHMSTNEIDVVYENHQELEMFAQLNKMRRDIKKLKSHNSKLELVFIVQIKNSKQNIQALFSSFSSTRFYVVFLLF